MTMQTRQLITRTLLIASVLCGTQLAHSGELDEIKASLIELVGARALSSTISESPMPDVYQVDLGDRIVYVSKVGNHMLLGDVFDITRRISLSEEIKQEKALLTIEAIDESEMVVFAPAETRRTITVYTDIDCPYCRKLHMEVPALVDNGVKVRYLWFPRSGVNTPSYDKAVSVWCADNQLKAMDDAKLNNKISSLKCDPNPVSSQYESGQKVGVRGTPTIVFDDGTIVGGYLPAKNLLASLGIDTEPVANAVQ